MAADTGEPIGFADVLLTPADTTLHRVGGLTNADGTFLLEAAPGHYTLRVRALSYATTQVDGIVIEEGKLLPFATTLKSEAIQQPEIVVEAKARDNTESSMLAARKKATSVGDAVSAEQVRKSPDKDAGEVLRRVTGLTVSDGKYVFVRGLGERYSSTEVDGVRIVSPEQNRRVVPMDLLPANLIENIVVQKTYTADRPGEFGGGDVQVRMKDFPGGRTWQLAIASGYNENITAKDRSTYPGGSGDRWGFGSSDRQIPDEVRNVAGDAPLKNGSPPYGFPTKTLANIAKSFTNVWSPTEAHTDPNAVYSATYGDEFKLMGRPLGLIASGTFGRAFDDRKETQRLFASGGDTTYSYDVNRSTTSTQLGTLAGLSYRLSPAHSLHLRAMFVNSADDEVRVYQGQDQNRIDGTTGTWIQHRDTRLMYVQRDVLSGTAEGKHQFPSVFGSDIDWKFTRSTARRQQPDRREVTYDNGYYYDGTGNLVEYWGLGSFGHREYGDLKDNGWGTTITAGAPYKLGSLGNGKVVFGYDRQTKDRNSFYRRFDFHANQNIDPTLPPDQLFDPGTFDGSLYSGYVEEATLPQDNYHASSKIAAGFMSVDVPLGKHLRSTLGVRLEHGFQDVKSHDLFDPSLITSQGSIDHADWLPSANVTWAVTSAINVRAAASRTLSRPDLNELSPSPTLEYVAGYQQAGNPNLDRAVLTNYDVRVEAFPSLSEVLAVGYFYKDLQEPIEQSIQGGVPPLLMPLNSDHGYNRGLEFEARAALGRYWGRLRRLSINTNATAISSSVTLKPQLTPLSDQVHPLQGQAAYSVNAGLTYSTPSGHTDASILFGAVGKRLRTLGYQLPDIYDQPTTTLDAAMNITPMRNVRLKLAARNLSQKRIQQLQGSKEVSGYVPSRTFTAALVFGL